MSLAAKVEGVSVVIACARIATSALTPWRLAKLSDISTAAAPPQVGGQAINLVITPGHMTWSFKTSSALTSLRNIASGLFLACRLALARILAKASSFVPYFFMCARPAPPK